MITLTLTQLCIFVLVLIFLAGIPAFVYLNYSENERLKDNNTEETERLLMNAIQLAVETEIKQNRV